MQIRNEGNMDMKSAFNKLRHAEPCWKSPIIIESHINGLRSKEHNPNIPAGYEEIAGETIKCREAGACAIHVHNTDMKLIGL
jgi:3-keto-5-aminohexanoate cleavage enzyme